MIKTFVVNETSHQVIFLGEGNDGIITSQDGFITYQVVGLAL